MGEGKPQASGNKRSISWVQASPFLVLFPRNYWGGGGGGGMNIKQVLKKVEIIIAFTLYSLWSPSRPHTGWTLSTKKGKSKIGGELRKKI